MLKIYQPGEQLQAMLLLATNKHHGQLDKSGQPYILHPLAVMYLLNSKDEELQCIALGHDIVEDTDVTIADLHMAFSDRVVEGIRCLSKIPHESFKDYKAKVMSNQDSIKVKIADIRHNSDITRLKGVTDKDIDRMAKYHKFYIELVQSLN